MTMSYEEAVREVAAIVNNRMAGVRHAAKHRRTDVEQEAEHALVSGLPLNTLRALLAGPPEREGWVLGELAKRPNLSLQAVPSDFEGEPSEWAVFREHGGRSDREFTRIAQAATPLAALTAALSAAPKP